MLRPTSTPPMSLPRRPDRHRTNSGKFAKGNPGGPGRPRRRPSPHAPFFLPDGAINPVYLYPLTGPGAKAMPNDQQLLADTQTNVAKLEQAEQLWSDLRSETLRRGFHGKAYLLMTIQDGTIQTVRTKLLRQNRP